MWTASLQKPQQSHTAEPDVLQVLSNLFSAADLNFESERALEVEPQLYRKGSADFADCLHIALTPQAGKQPLWNFDKGAAEVSGAQLLRTRKPAADPGVVPMLRCLAARSRLALEQPLATDSSWPAV